MDKKIGIISALALVTSQSGLPASAMGIDASQQHSLCSIFDNEPDRAVLQDELAFLLENDPNSLCVDFLVEKLGGSPVALIDQEVPY